MPIQGMDEKNVSFTVSLGLSESCSFSVAYDLLEPTVNLKSTHTVGKAVVALSQPQYAALAFKVM